MTNAPTARRTRWGAAAGLLAASTAFVAIAGAGPAPSLLQLASNREDVSGNCDEAEHANDPACATTATTAGGSSSTTVDDSTSTTLGGPGSTTPADEIRTIDANGAGLVIVAVEGGSLRLVAATPSAGWQVEIEHAVGREIEVDFRSGSKRVQVNVEIEDGEVRERVRTRDDASDGTTPPTIGEDSHGPGQDDANDDLDDANDDLADANDDHRGSGPGGDADSEDGDDSSGPSNDD